MFFYLFNYAPIFITTPSGHRTFIQNASSSSNRGRPQQKSEWNTTTQIWLTIPNKSLWQIRNFNRSFTEDSGLSLASTEDGVFETSETTNPATPSTNRYRNQTCENGSLSFSELLLSLSKEIAPRNVHASVCLSLRTAFKPAEPEFMQLQCRTKQARALLYCYSQIGTSQLTLPALCCLKTVSFRFYRPRRCPSVVTPTAYELYWKTYRDRDTNTGLLTDS